MEDGENSKLKQWKFPVSLGAPAAGDGWFTTNGQSTQTAMN